MYDSRCAFNLVFHFIESVHCILLVDFGFGLCDIAGCWKRTCVAHAQTRLIQTIKEHKREIEMLEVEAIKTHDAVWLVPLTSV
jgi:hypothetical protein